MTDSPRRPARPTPPVEFPREIKALISLLAKQAAIDYLKSRGELPP